MGCSAQGFLCGNSSSLFVCKASLRAANKSTSQCVCSEQHAGDHASNAPSLSEACHVSALLSSLASGGLSCEHHVWPVEHTAARGGPQVAWTWQGMKRQPHRRQENRVRLFHLAFMMYRHHREFLWGKSWLDTWMKSPVHFLMLARSFLRFRDISTHNNWFKYLYNYNNLSK